MITEAEITDAEKQMLEDDPEIIIALRMTGGTLGMAIIPRDEEIDQASPATIFASYLNHNFDLLCQQSKAAYEQWVASQAPPANALDSIPQRTILGLDGNVIRSTDGKGADLRGIVGGKF